MPIDASSKLYFEASGPETARTIVFLHGGGVGGWMWRKVVAALQADFHCLVPDLPEQGRNIGTGGTAYTTQGAAVPGHAARPMAGGLTWLGFLRAPR